MGLMSWLRKRRVKKEMGKLKPSKTEETADEFLKLSSDKYTNTLKTAEKINKANLFRLKEKQLKEEIKAGLDNGEEEDDEDEDEEEDDEGLKILQNVLLPMITNKEKLQGMDIQKLIGMAQALPPEQLADLLKKLKLS